MDGKLWNHNYLWALESYLMMIERIIYNIWLYWEKSKSLSMDIAMMTSLCKKFFSWHGKRVLLHTLILAKCHWSIACCRQLPPIQTAAATDTKHHQAVAQLGWFGKGMWYNYWIIIISQRFYRWLITSLKVIANFFDMSNLMEDDVMSGATDSVEK